MIWLRPKPRRTFAQAPALPDLDKALVNPAAVFRSPDDVVRHPLLTVNCKREILQRWAWNEYLLELATNEAMPEGEPSRLDEVKCALLLLDEERGPDPAARDAWRLCCRIAKRCRSPPDANSHPKGKSPHAPVLQAFPSPSRQLAILSLTASTS